MQILRRRKKHYIIAHFATGPHAKVNTMINLNRNNVYAVQRCINPVKNGGLRGIYILKTEAGSTLTIRLIAATAPPVEIRTVISAKARYIGSV